jgi:hypothetical protein
MEMTVQDFKRLILGMIIFEHEPSSLGGSPVAGPTSSDSDIGIRKSIGWSEIHFDVSAERRVADRIAPVD